MFYQNLSTSTRLIILLTLTVSVVMAVATFLPLREREASLKAAAEDEVRAHAVTLQLALEEDLSSKRQLDAQRLINRMSENTGIKGVILFNQEGAITLVSDSTKPNGQDIEEARKVIQTGQSTKIERQLDGSIVLSMIMPLRDHDQIKGAVEISAPITFVQQLKTQNRLSALMTWLLLCFAIFLVVVFVTNRSLMSPIKALLSGAEAVTRGDLTYRIHVPESGKEFITLADAFNRMASSLDEQRQRAIQEADERLKLERQLRHSERLAAVGHLAAGVAHEMGAPLQVIDGRAKQLQESSGINPEKQTRNLQIIRTQTERITRIVRSLLNLSRPYKPKLVELDLASLLHQTLESLEVQLTEQNIKIDHQPRADYLINGDKDLLGQVFLNLCVNALHAMPKGGLLRVAYERTTAPMSTCEYIVVRIFDSGAGIHADHLNHIFDPFYTTKEVGHGTGLGLAVSSRIIEEHRGWIEAANWQDEKYGAGAMFAVHLPLCVGKNSSDETPEMALEAL